MRSDWSDFQFDVKLESLHRDGWTVRLYAAVVRWYQREMTALKQGHQRETTALKQEHERETTTLKQELCKAHKECAAVRAEMERSADQALADAANAERALSESRGATAARDRELEHAAAKTREAARDAAKRESELVRVKMEAQRAELQLLTNFLLCVDNPLSARHERRGVAHAASRPLCAGSRCASPSSPRSRC